MVVGECFEDDLNMSRVLFNYTLKNTKLIYENNFYA